MSCRQLFFWIGVLCVSTIEAQVQIQSELIGVSEFGSIHRVYASLPDSALVLSMYADSEAPLQLSTNGTVFQSDNSALLAHSNASESVDSWFTLGQPLATNATAQMGGAGWTEAMDAFEGGEGFSCADSFGGAFYLLPGSTQAQVLGPFLLGQFVSHDTLSLTLNIQWKAHPDTASTYSTGLNVIMEPSGLGCTDPSAMNYDANALFDNGSCVWQENSFEGLEYSLHQPSEGGMPPTYRIYARVTNPNERLSAWYGSEEAELLLETTTEFYQSQQGTARFPGLNAVSEVLNRDSWFGLGQSESLVVVGLTEAAFEAGGALTSDAEFGGGIAAMPGTELPAPDENQRVLLAQVTTDGSVQFKANIALKLENGSVIETEGEELVIPAQFGCTDPNACNYDDQAILTDGSCLYLDALDVCGGACSADENDNGICDDAEEEEGAGFIGLSHEQVAAMDNGIVVHRVYAQFDGPGYEVMALFGDAESPMVISSEFGFYQSEDAGPLATDLPNPSSGSSIYDSWLTIGGVENASDLFTIGIDFNAFEGGGDIIVDSELGGSLFTVPGSSESSVSGSLGRVLIAQLSSHGSVDIAVNVKYETPSGNSPEVLGLLAIATSNPGCTDPQACNFNFYATIDNGSCQLVTTNCQSCEDGNLIEYDEDGDGVCDDDETSGCTHPDACNSGLYTDTDNAQCQFPENYPNNLLDCIGECLMDSDSDGVCDQQEVEGCTEVQACNYDAAATDDDGSCILPDSGYDCDGNCAEDADGDGICDPFEYAGCHIEEACNYDPLVDSDMGSVSLCQFPSDVHGSDHVDCNGQCLHDFNGNGVCDEDEIYGCTYLVACNYDESATVDNGTCTYALPGQYCDGSCMFDFNGDGACDEPGSGGCTYPDAYNYDTLAPFDDGTCEFPSGDCRFDSNGDGGINIPDLLDMLGALGNTCPQSTE